MKARRCSLPLSTQLYVQQFVQGRWPGGQLSFGDIGTTKTALLDELALGGEPAPLATQLLWLEGNPAPMCRPQSQRGIAGHGEYKGSAPFSITCAKQHLVQLGMGRVQPDGEGSMMLRRVQIFSFHTRIAPPPLPRIPPCPCCFMKLLVHGVGSVGGWS